MADERVFGNAGTVSSVSKTNENDIPKEMDSAAIGLEGRNLVSESSTKNEKASVKDVGDALVSGDQIVSPIPELDEANTIMEETGFTNR